MKADRTWIVWPGPGSAEQQHGERPGAHESSGTGVSGRTLCSETHTLQLYHRYTKSNPAIGYLSGDHPAIEFPGPRNLCPEVLEVLVTGSQQAPRHSRTF